ncbi:cytochrome c peroxidase [Desulfosporosinus orientis DSM 765]|uniref:Cytochrome c peroxidase n=1 Tax=Desulfosporosinus orientis (strain ATCC 19365 / DSM 765 / NCIMB 8382 / VKM B-1628 / Singapore I) TaxID=768706 RepID=G7WFA3_DESOD|nr:cytochrome-c peroxidase [Desulfosporosinus orientis]AET67989.1 cytochrome c peroxidase [Desulfosporosinus orientis DSM 765]
MSKKICILIFTMSLIMITMLGTAFAGETTPKQALGKLLFFDTNLSTPNGMSCSSCHDPSVAFTDPDSNLPVSQGVVPRLFGNRNSPSAAYAAFSPTFQLTANGYVGGQFWDGRAANLVEQAKGPFLNPLEMHNPNKQAVISAVFNSNYASLFTDVYGDNAFDNVEIAYNDVADAIAAYENTDELNKFTSKYDYYLKGETTLTEQEKLGLELFNDPNKGNCTACHSSQIGPYNADHPLFTDYSYDNLGVPKNWDSPYLYLPRAFNPEGKNYVDLGLGGVLNDPNEYGKFKVPSLRNVSITYPYMHNGYFKTLREVVNFYNTRDIDNWPAPEVPENVNKQEVGNLGLTSDEVDAIVAFLNTLTDGYQP